VSTTEELLDRKSSRSWLENREHGRRDPSRCPRGNLYPQKLAITSPTSGGRSVVIVRPRTQTMEFFLTYRTSTGNSPLAQNTSTGHKCLGSCCHLGLRDCTLVLSKIMKMRMFTTLDKARPHTENIRGSNLAAVTCTTVQVSKTAVID
jgi:hypothetical protein